MAGRWPRGERWQRRRRRPAAQAWRGSPVPLDSDDLCKCIQAHAGRTRATPAARSLAADSSSATCPGRCSQTMLDAMKQPVARHGALKA